MPLRAAFFSCLVLSAVLLASCWKGISRQVLATVLSVRGEVVCGMDGGNDFPPVTLQTKFGAGSIVRTFQDSILNVSLIPAALVRVSGNSELKIEQLRLTKDGNETEDGMRSRIVRVQLNRGKISALFQLRDESETRFTVGTRHATISADDDCLFQVQEEETKTRVTCVRGKIYVSQGDHQTELEAGYFQEWPSRISAAVPVDNDARGQLDVSDTLGAEQELQDLQARQRVRLPSRL